MAKKTSENTTASAKRAPARRGKAAGAGDLSSSAAAVGTAADSSKGIVGTGSSEGSPAGAGPTADEIAQAAYLRYLSRGGTDGRDFDDWIEAERELSRRNGTQR